MSGREAIGVDLGGTKMLVGAVGEDAAVLSRNVARSHGRTTDQLLELLESELREALGGHPSAAAIGLGVPCTIDRRRGVAINAVNLPISEVPIGKLVESRLELPTAIDNDANLAALAEHRHGAARGATNAVMLTLGTGIGGGLIIDGRPYRGSIGAAAELGHMVVDFDGPPCQGSCPNRGCIETFASGTALAREGRLAAERAPDTELGRALAAGERIDGRRVTMAALDGDPGARRVITDAGRMLGVALSGLANAFDPDVIVIGGGVVAAGELLLEPAREELRQRALPQQNEVPVRVAELGDEAGLIGAAIMALEEAA